MAPDSLFRVIMGLQYMLDLFLLKGLLGSFVSQFIARNANMAGNPAYSYRYSLVSQSV
jgi:hypothetical protein